MYKMTLQKWKQKEKEKKAIYKKPKINSNVSCVLQALKIWMSKLNK